MILIDQPYVSGFLKDTLKRNHFPVVATGQAKALLGDVGFPFITEKDAVKRFDSHGSHPLYTNSENSIAWIERNLAFTGLPAKIRLFKDKNAFRDLIRPMYPDLFYQKFSYQELIVMDPGSIPFPVIVKPSTGFFSLGVHRIDNRDAWEGVMGKIEAEAASINNLYPEEVLDTRDFIVEQYIEGDEYAIDCYFDKEGKPVVLSILHHLFSSENDVSDRVYITSVEIIESLMTPIVDFLTSMGHLAGLQNFPAHVEVRIDRKGKVVPIEVNPMRFGGWCTTADLTWYAWGFNAYEYYQLGSKPDWDLICRQHRGTSYSVVVLDNSTGIKGENIPGFDYDALRRAFSRPLEIRPVDYRIWPLFGFVLCESKTDNLNDLYQILRSDLKEYLKD
ncbi:MAG TPA: ATP-grasp domain-containing protein [Bacteroidales bacterium]|nr:ATP-grasp domain-containing protein [Bacteroidales bacterium]